MRFVTVGQGSCVIVPTREEYGTWPNHRTPYIQTHDELIEFLKEKKVYGLEMTLAEYNDALERYRAEILQGVETTDPQCIDYYLYCGLSNRLGNELLMKEFFIDRDAITLGQ